MTEKKRWLTLSEASKLLGVHPATLRHWADTGQVPSYRTPGGHRRFTAEELRAFLMRASISSPQDESASPEADLLKTALAQARNELRRLPVSEMEWYSAFDEAGRKRQRILGRQLYEHAVNFITHPNERDTLLLDARELGASYAHNLMEYDITLLEAVRAFQFFRQKLLTALTASDIAPRWAESGNLDFREDADLFLNEVLFGLIDVYERTLLEPVHAHP
ncbi:MAG: helix-turn-helix domain-containing protein [Chloroflexi bacterium]|nr:helix-turn-helix domain-containing protein [Chloroflexota bacterium]